MSFDGVAHIDVASQVRPVCRVLEEKFGQLVHRQIDLAGTAAIFEIPDVPTEFRVELVPSPPS